MSDESFRFNRRLSILIAASFVFGATMIALRLGLNHTGFEVTDSTGAPMGFNDPLGREHHWILLQNFRVSDLASSKHTYEWIWLAMHGIGAALLLAGQRIPVRLTRWFFALQCAVFPIGVLGMLLLPFIATDFVMGWPTDREGFVDIPFITCTAHAAWVLTSLVLVIALRGEGLGLSRIWKTARRIGQASATTVAAALR
jgi:hypothetical protein